MKKILACAAAVAVTLTLAPTADAATVLNVEGIVMPRGTTAKAFQGELCKRHACVNVNNMPMNIPAESQRLQEAINNTEGPIILQGWSLGAATITDTVQEWQASTRRVTAASVATPPKIELIVTFGNPWAKYGGSQRKSDAGREGGVDWPEELGIPHLDVVAQYDSAADVPARFGLWSWINLSMSQHFSYFEADLNDPDNLVFNDGTTTHMLIPADVLPMLRWMDWFLSDETMAELDAKFRPLVEKDYDRPAYVPQGEGADWGNGKPAPKADNSTARAVSNQDAAGDDDQETAKVERKKLNREEREERRTEREERTSRHKKEDESDERKSDDRGSADKPSREDRGGRDAGDHESTSKSRDDREPRVRRGESQERNESAQAE